MYDSDGNSLWGYVLWVVAAIVLTVVLASLGYEPLP